VDQKALLHAVVDGATLKVHRTLDGAKEYRLHHLDGGVEAVESHVVDRLVRRGWLDSNMKFPAATFLVTPAGRRALAK
jgi:hypothetical protein